MYFVGINGSPNNDGNTHFLVSSVLENIKQKGHNIDIINVGDVLKELDNPFCVVCTNPCSGVCYKGTKLENEYEKLQKASGIIIGSPSYFGTVSGQLKAFFDKTRLLRQKKSLYGKIGAAVSVGASRFGGQETTIKAIHDIMLVHGMAIVGDGYIDDDCGHHGVCAQRPSNEDEFAKKRIEIISKRMLESIRNN